MKLFHILRRRHLNDRIHHELDTLILACLLILLKIAADRSYLIGIEQAHDHAHIAVPFEVLHIDGYISLVAFAISALRYVLAWTHGYA